MVNEKGGAASGEPVDSFKSSEVGDEVQAAFMFLEKLWSGNTGEGVNPGKKLRDDIYGLKTVEALRHEMREKHNISIPENIGHVIIVDVENGKSKTLKSSEKGGVNHYTLVLPPCPRRELIEKGIKGKYGGPDMTTAYVDEQRWKASWYHATNDGYGM